MAFAPSRVVTDVISVDTTGLPPGATFGASSGGLDGATQSPGATTDPTLASSQAGPTVHGLKVGQSFGPRYRILKLLGAGGMGVVYQAWDSELSVAVALKVILGDARRGSVSAELEKRFKNELLLARQVTHKHVVRIHDLGEINGIKYITMPYVEGDNLATVLRRDGRLPIGRALKLGRQMASGLEAAHEAGVVHRDLKPANIMITADDQALIMDFGISASVSDAASGDIIGTLDYMAPEQSRGGVVDGRADIYAFGLILYEMIIGPGRAISGSAQERLDRMRQRVERGVPPLRVVDGSIPEPVDALVTRCLELDPAGRFQVSAQLTAALAAIDDAGELIPVPPRVSKRMLTAAAVLALTVAASTFFVGRQSVPIPMKHPIVPVLVTDFANRSGDATFDGRLGAQALSIALEGAPFVQLYSVREARSVAMQLSKDHSDHITADTGKLIARREAIKVLVEGAIDKRSSGYRVTVRAVDPVTDATLISATEDAANRATVLNAIDLLAKRVRVALGESKTQMDKVAAAETFTAASLDAMSAYARGQDLAGTGKVQEAILAYQDAIARDPQLGRAYAGMASIYRNLGQMDKAEASFKDALKNVDRMTEREKYRTLGSYYIGVARNYPKAIETYEDLIARYPGDQAGLSNLALANSLIGKFERAVAVSKQLVDTYPSYLLGRNNYAAYALYAGDFATAIHQTDMVLQQNPSYQFAFLPRALAYLSNGDSKAGLDAYARLEQLNAFGASLTKLGLADASMYQGKYREAVKLLVPAIAVDEKASNAAAAAAKYVALAEAYAALDRRDAAVSAANKAAAVGGDESVLLPAALTFLWAGQEQKAGELADRLDHMPENTQRSYARIIAGETLRRHHRANEAIDALRDAQKRHDSWWSRFALGRIYTETDRYPEAFAELDLTIKRRGEGADAFIADTPTLRFVGPAYYWLGRSQEGMDARAAAKRSYNEFLKLRGQTDAADPLVVDARKRAASIAP